MTAYSLYAFQKKGVRKINHFGGRALVADEMGLGKTIEALEWWKQSKLSPCVVVCSASLKWVWEHEAFVHSNIRATVLSGRTPAKSVSSLTDHQLIVVNYDILDAWKEWILQLKPQVLIADEVQKIKTWGTQRTKATKWLGGKIPHILALSGTPLTNRPDELYNTLNLIRPDIYNSRYAYRWRYCSPKKTYWGWDFKGASHLDELHRNLKSTMMIRRLKADVLTELPAKQRTTVPLDIEHPKEYKEALNNFIVWLTKKSAAKAQKALAAQSLVQLGYLKRLAAELKMKAALQWIDTFMEESSEKLVVFCIHKKIVDVLKERYKKTCVVIVGGVSSKKRKQAVQEFQTNKKTRLFIGNIIAAGEGLTLTAASTLAFVELDWVPANHIQAEDRIHRIGQENVAMIYYLVAKDTLEESLCAILQEKQEILSKTLDGKVQKNDLNLWSQLQTELLKGA